MNTNNNKASEQENPRDDSRLICERCGTRGAFIMGERCLCETCYFECNSCCGEFGSDDRSELPPPESE